MLCYFDTHMSSMKCCVQLKTLYLHSVTRNCIRLKDGSLKTKNPVGLWGENKQMGSENSENQGNGIKNEEPLQQGNGIKNSKFLGSRRSKTASFWDQDRPFYSVFGIKDDKFLGSDRK